MTRDLATLPPALAGADWAERPSFRLAFLRFTMSTMLTTTVMVLLSAL